MEKKCRFSYNEIDDSLIISCRGENENVKENFMFDDLIFYLADKGKIVGLQIKNISSLISESGFNPKILENLKEITLSIIQREHSLFMRINLISSIESVKLPLGRIFIPQPKAILNFLFFLFRNCF